MSTLGPIVLLQSYHVASLRMSYVEVKLILPTDFSFPKLGVAQGV